jgi:hypothetical protein
MRRAGGSSRPPSIRREASVHPHPSPCGAPSRPHRQGPHLRGAGSPASPSMQAPCRAHGRDKNQAGRRPVRGFIHARTTAGPNHRYRDWPVTRARRSPIGGPTRPAGRIGTGSVSLRPDLRDGSRIWNGTPSRPIQPAYLPGVMTRGGPVIRRLACIVLILVAAPGCGPHWGWLRRGRSDIKPATVGADRTKVLRGTTIPPAGLGVDLVRKPRTSPNSLRSSRDDRVRVATD